MLTLQHVLKALLGHGIGELDFKLPEAFIDSRSVSESGLFFALRGERTDGHLYVDDAFAGGASLAVIDRPIQSAYPIVDLRAAEPKLPERAPFSLLTDDSLLALQKIASYWRSQFDIKVIGITGSVGKSSTKELTANVLSKRLVTLKNPGNLNNEIGMPLSILKLTEEHEVAVLEMGFYVPGEIKLLCDIARPQIGIVTNIGTVHAERAGSIDVIAQGKAELVQALPPAPEGVAILNYDDERVLAMAAKTKARVFTYGLCPQADLWADQVESMGLEGIRCRIHYQGDSFYVTAPLIGRHSVYTMLRSAAAALSLGFSWDWIFYALKTSNLQLRIATTKTASGALLIDDTYNASPDSTLAALNLLDDLSGRKVAVLGDMLELGQYEDDGHQRVGIRAAQVADEIVLVGQRSLKTQAAAIESGFPPEKIHWFPDQSGAARYLQDTLKEHDIALIKGSHAMHMDLIVASLEVVS
ncbi:MAG TPA: UDP-N-acetylmuramoyl-tripeptide--D-alanyl-D-alanine ligase [Anaerolineaceae bacterium]|mgnify:FL=1|nr:UDP-N-acetylmuramoyl-tripeptide--D-alanyl-D-alanine ligase [Anaerolineaceae bacterium]HOT26005.1 UDP-N-acetylmuramoyl-tripeptide--D-alanyl-D-alanine ligase [Anaerolineaceae bacterium]HQK02672.1 UDP-N-acetylmuramoyl-tripeptide--D-alanyl-D-alanine ligase [Anaerolineaceae bacterium]